MSRFLTRRVAPSNLDRVVMFCASHPGPGGPPHHLREIALDGCLLQGRCRGRLVAVAGLDLDEFAVIGPWVHEDAPDESEYARRLLVAVERLAIQFGITRVTVFPAKDQASFFARNRYWKMSGRIRGDGKHVGMSRSLTRRLTDYARTVREINHSLGIPENYGATHRLRLQKEAARLESIGKDIYARQQQMAPAAARAWRRMVLAARKDVIEIAPVSAYRPVSYQAELVRKKLERGQSVREILRVSAAPGYSEHHSGKAIDLTTPGSPVLEEEFEESPVFAWLLDNASKFGFSLSYPRDNRHGVAYEPWHWCWRR